MTKSIFIDIPRCINCRACEIACAREHKGVSLISPVVVDEKWAVPISCRQCEKAPCIEICTPKALVRNAEGAIIVDPAKCNGCRFCIMACPYKAVQNDLANRIVRICDLCTDRLREGKRPVCVLTCPTNALIFDEFDQVLERLRERAARKMIKASGLKQ